MHCISTVTMVAGALAVVSTLAAPPAEAGRACNELGLDSPCVGSTDLKARLNLDEDGRDARLRLRDENGESAVELDARSANVISLFSNDQDESNGLVKAWAQIHGDGTIEACWRCNTDPNETRRVSTGIFEVDFTPLATDISGRPRSATADNLVGGATPVVIIGLADRDDDASSVAVSLTDDAGDAINRSFVLIIY